MNKGVLIITSHYPPNIGGVESHLQALIDELRKYGWKVVISTYQPLASKIKSSRFEKADKLIIYRMRWPGFNLIHTLFPYPFLEFLYLFPGLFFISLQSLFKHSKDIKVIHCQGLVPSVIGIILGKLFSKRIISSTHNLYFFPKDGLYKSFSKFIFSAADQVLTPSKAAKIELIRIGVPKQKIKPFKYWIDLKAFTPVDKRLAKEKLGWKGFVIFFAGRLIETKGVNILLEVAKRVKGIKFVIAGTGPQEEEVKKAASFYSNLYYLGRVENKKLPVYYNAADLVVVPSLVDEGFGFVVMEAIACGTPVLASDRGGLSDAVSKNTGRLFEPNINNLKESIEYYFSNPKALSKIRNNCRKYALKNFSKGNVGDIIKAYD